MSSALVLFDVDGTLLLSGGASTRCIRRAAERVFQERLVWGEITSGTLDQQIFRDIAQRSEVLPSETLLNRYRREYLRELEAELARCAGKCVLPGVTDLLQELSRRGDVVCGILTGNFRDAVRLKLAAVGLEESFFTIGVFAEDGDCRADLVPAALKQLRQRKQLELPPSHVVLIGDTPRDIACARTAGCHVVAVATGHYSLEDLAVYRPDRLLRDLRNRDAILSLIESLSSPR